MNPYLEPPGIFGTGASLLADLTLIAYLLILIPAMVIGYSYARRGKHRPQHRWVMTGVTIANWLLIAFLMVAAYRFDVIDNISRQPTNLRYLLPTVHGILGFPAQLFATIIIVRMLIEDRAIAAAKRRGETQMRPYFWKIAKPMMQITLALWLATSALGIASYVIRYNVIQTPLAPGGDAPGNLQPVITPEVVSTPETVATPEVQAELPVQTPDVVSTPEAQAGEPTALPERIMALVQTEEVAATPEVMPASATSPVSPPQVAVTPEVGATATATIAPPRVAMTPELSGEPEMVGAALSEAGRWLRDLLAGLGNLRLAAATPEVAMTPEVVNTPEVVSTREVGDDSGRGRGRGRGRGGDDNSGDNN